MKIILACWNSKPLTLANGVKWRVKRVGNCCPWPFGSRFSAQAPTPEKFSVATRPYVFCSCGNCLPRSVRVAGPSSRQQRGADGSRGRGSEGNRMANAGQYRQRKREWWWQSGARAWADHVYHDAWANDWGWGPVSSGHTNPPPPPPPPPPPRPPPQFRTWR